MAETATVAAPNAGAPAAAAKPAMQQIKGVVKQVNTGDYIEQYCLLK